MLIQILASVDRFEHPVVPDASGRPARSTRHPPMQQTENLAKPTLAPNCQREVALPDGNPDSPDSQQWYFVPGQFQRSSQVPPATATVIRVKLIDQLEDGQLFAVKFVD